MVKKSLRNTIGINLGAFFLVFILELLSGWMLIDQFETTYSFYLWGFSYTISIMVVIWINHFVLIPYFFDQKRYFLYSLLLIVSILIGVYLKIYARVTWTDTTKMFFFLISTTGAGMAIFFIRRYVIIKRETDEKEKLQKEMELTYLKEQVNPHFLFNSLNSIYSLSRQQSPETSEVVMQLSELMRYQLESAKKDTVLLKEELEFLENYLLLEEKRLSKRCTIEFSIKGDVLELKIAPMLLIPFVENAIKHGALSTNKQSTIDISVSVDNKALDVCITNSKPSIISQSKREGIGLKNVKRRLNLLYPNLHSLEIDDKKDAYHVNLIIDLIV